MTPKFVFSKEKNDWIKRPLLSNIEKILDYRGRTPKKLGLSWSDTGFLALSALNVKNGYIDFNADANYGDQELYNRWMGDNNLHKGQVVFTTEAPMGNVAQIPNDALYILSQRTIAFEVKHHLIREDFLATLLRSPKIFNELTSLSSGGTAKGISQKSLSNLKISLPASLDEQSAIGSLFRTLDDLLASYKNNLANYQSLKATMLSKMFPKDGEAVPEIRLDGFEDEWRKCYLGSIFEQVSNYIEPSVDNELWSLTVEKGLTPKTDRYKRDFLVKKNDKFKKVDINEFVYNPMNLTLGALDLNNNKITISVSGYYVVMKNKDVEKFDNDFLKILLKTTYAIYQYKQFATGTLIEKQRVQFPTFSEIPFYLPTIDEQQVIGAYFSKLDQLITSYQDKITQLETLKKKLLQDMFI